MFGLIAFIVIGHAAPATVQSLPTLAWKTEKSCDDALLKLKHDMRHVTGSCIWLQPTGEEHHE